MKKNVGYCCKQKSDLSVCLPLKVEIEMKKKEAAFLFKGVCDESVINNVGN